jgi:hypothetical protein
VNSQSGTITIAPLPSAQIEARFDPSGCDGELLVLDSPSLIYSLNRATSFDIVLKNGRTILAKISGMWIRPKDPAWIPIRQA